MADIAQERTEQPTAKRLEDARKRGQVPRSPELAAAAVVLVAGGGLELFGRHAARTLYALMQSSLALRPAQVFDEGALLGTLASCAAQALVACAPILLLTLAAALAAPLALGGWNLSFEALVPDFTRLSPQNIVQRIFSMRSLVELAKAYAKFLLVAAIGVAFVWKSYGRLFALGSEPLESAIADSASLCGSALLALASGLGIIAAIDVPWQLFSHRRQLRMTRQEIRDEFKESEGSPEVKGRIRRMQQEVARRRMMQEVPKADVVVVNPTHFAVALRYDERRMRAPAVVAKGTNEVAARIREVAAEHRVPIFEAPPLARALHRAVPIGGEVPASLYVAVAQVLTYVYQVRAAAAAGVAPPAPPHIETASENADIDDAGTRH
ncbi:MAG TPA: flagellar biosynthesis protein FlhB [Steroidobacteraceae bacterium]|nr:flagellar biosynthesis protein FlhB [Steroidobacteraceae bacterium]